MNLTDEQLAALAAHGFYKEADCMCKRVNGHPVAAVYPPFLPEYEGQQERRYWSLYVSKNPVYFKHGDDPVSLITAAVLVGDL